MNWPLLLDWAVPSAIGYAFGYLTCLLVAKAVRDEDSEVPQRQRRSQLARTIFGVLLIILAIATFVDSQQTNACFRDAIEVRDSATNREIEEQIELLTTDTGGDREAGRAAVGDYVEALHELQRVRAENPLECR